MKRSFAATFAVFMLAMVVFFMLTTLAHAQQNPGEGGVQHVICDSGCSGGSGGGTVDQGAAGMSPWPVLFASPQTITFGGTPQPVTFTMPALVASSAVIGHVIVDNTVPVTMDITLQAVADAITGGAPVAKTLNDVVNQLGAGVGITDGFAPVSIIHNPFSLYSGVLATTLDPMLPLPAGTNLLGTVGIDQTTPGTTNAVRTQSGSTTAVTGTVTVTGPLTDTQLRATPVPVSGTVTANAGTNLNTSALALEAGGNLASIKAKTDNIDVALSTRLKPADTLTAVTTVGTITNPVTVAQPTAANLNATVVGTGTFAAQVTGTVTANAGTNLNTSALALEAGNLASIKAKTDNLDVALSTRLKPADTLTAVTTVGTVTSVTAIANALPAGSNVIGHVIHDTGSTTAVTGTVTVTGPLTDTQLRATPVPVSGTVAVTSAGLTNLDVALSTRLKPADTLTGVTTVGTVSSVTAIASALPAGTNLLGKVGIDQTTPGTTNGVQVNAALPTGTNVIGHVIHDTGSTTVVTGNVTVVQPTGTNLHTVSDITDTSAGPFTLNSNQTSPTGSGALIAMAGKTTASFHLAAGTLNGSVLPYYSVDGGSNWQFASMIDANGQRQSSAIGVGSIGPSDYTILVPGGTTHVGVAALWSSGSVAASLKATNTTGDIRVVQGARDVLVSVNPWYVTIPDGAGNAMQSMSSPPSVGTASLPVVLSPNTSPLILPVTDGTRIGTVKASSTLAALPTDTALVVTARDTVTTVQTLGLPKAPCNNVRRTNCQSKGF